MRRFKRAAVLGATLLAFTGAAAGAAQANGQPPVRQPGGTQAPHRYREHRVEMPGHIRKDCQSAKTQRMLDSSMGGRTHIDGCSQEHVRPGFTPTMWVYWHYVRKG